MIKIFFIFIISTFLLGCQNIKDGLTLQKQSNADEDDAPIQRDT